MNVALDEHFRIMWILNEDLSPLYFLGLLSKTWGSLVFM
jgi:hypothetical protein